jgi:hypothetical protein
MLPSHGESTVENTLPENASEVSTQISDSDTPKNIEDQIILQMEPSEQLSELFCQIGECQLL